MERKERIEKVLLDHPICEYAFGTTDQIPFSPRVRQICQSDCARYGHCWACPPYCGTFTELRDRCLSYQQFCIFSTVTESADAWNTQEDLKVKKHHEKITAEIRSELRSFLSDFCMLSTGCMHCAHCSCPQQPCRFPEERIYSIESHGIVVLQLARELGLAHTFGGDTVVYFSMFLY